MPNFSIMKEKIVKCFKKVIGGTKMETDLIDPEFEEPMIEIDSFAMSTAVGEHSSGIHGGSGDKDDTEEL